MNVVELVSVILRKAIESYIPAVNSCKPNQNTLNQLLLITKL